MVIGPAGFWRPVPGPGPGKGPQTPGTPGATGAGPLLEQEEAAVDLGHPSVLRGPADPGGPNRRRGDPKGAADPGSAFTCV